MNRFAALLMSIGTVSALASASLAGDLPLSVDLSAHRIAVASDFSGTDLVLFGSSRDSKEVVVKIRGPLRQELVRRKARTAGVWVNRKEVLFEDVPAYYAVAGNGSSVAEPLQPEVATVFSAPFWAALLRHKEREGLFRSDPIPVRFLGDGLFRADLHLPANAPVGDYRIHVLQIQEGAVARSTEKLLTLSRVGIGAEVFDFAHAHPLAYGILAVALAITAGWLANLLFRGKA